MDARYKAIYGERITRRETLRRVLYGVAGLTLGSRLGASVFAGTEEPVPVPVSEKIKAKSVIQVFLWGGMSHIDTWDPNPEASRDYTGDLGRAIPTNVDGFLIGQLFPQLAKQADKFSLIRSITHRNNGHETAAYLMQTGYTPGERISYPSVGAVFAYFKRPAYKGLLPPYVVLTRPQGRFPEEGFLEPLYKPFATGSDPNAPRFEVEGIVARGITDDRQKARRELLDKMDTMGHAMGASPRWRLRRTRRSRRMS